ncbi:DUF2283 domain-containing protein [Priestia aryabhattai]|uniref:DUF2283 domain-containing protein n=1 Tax=Priestia aryabhattai TaxID=412384 RepID=A0AAX6NF25_PRIAR|nr:DUF2283 domain-containing protein [Priestia aryabhattai]MDU9694094.1 DUF2283 domain-containing protein [Priestia aryabhattai]NGY88610.1 DUF2283 domain-containing protein [Priestia megaterium]
MISSFKHITYDKESEMAYIYLVDPLKHRIASTEELEQNDEIVLDLGESCPIVGIELEGKATSQIATLPEHPKYQKVTSKDGSINYILLLSNREIKREVQYPGVNTVTFLFADQECEEFVGISIVESKWYCEAHFLGGNS